MHMLKKWEKRYVHYPTDVLGGALAGASGPNGTILFPISSSARLSQ